MIPDTNPHDPSTFEQRLQRRHVPEPSAALQSSIMHAVTLELSCSRLPTRPGGDFLSFAAAMAAVLLIGLNLSLTASSAKSFDSRSKSTLQQTVAAAQTLRQLSPDLSAAEATRISVIFQAAGNLAPLPELATDAARNRRRAGNPNFERTVQ